MRALPRLPRQGVDSSSQTSLSKNLGEVDIVGRNDEEHPHTFFACPIFRWNRLQLISFQ